MFFFSDQGEVKDCAGFFEEKRSMSPSSRIIPINSLGKVNDIVNNGHLAGRRMANMRFVLLLYSRNKSGKLDGLITFLNLSIIQL